MKSFPYYLILLLVTFSFKKAEEERWNQEEVVSEVSQPLQRNINATDIFAPERYKIEAIEKGFPYPVDMTFDQKGNYYIAEAGDHTYGTKPQSAPEAQILMVGPNKQLEIFPDQVVPITEVRVKISSESLK